MKMGDRSALSVETVSIGTLDLDVALGVVGNP